MCAYNGLPFIKEAVSNILHQTYPNIELIISDDGSNDGTREWLKTLSEEPRVRLFFQETNLGYVANKNFAHRQATGEYITQQDNDDTSALDRIERQYEALKESGCKISACGYFRISPKGEIHSPVAFPTDEIVDSRGDEDYPFWFPSLLVHRSVFDEIGPFPDYFAGAFGDDLYWTVRANERYPIVCVGEALYGYRENHGSITATLDNPRKLVMPAVLQELLRQRATTHSDWLEQGRFDELAKLERKLQRSRRYRSEQLRAYAARGIDSGDLRKAARLLGRAWLAWPFSGDWYRTAAYLVRQPSRR